MRFAVILPMLIGAVTTAVAADYPQAEISNGLITARLYLPDAARGYYRGTRFDWSGVIYSLTYKGHEYFGEWQQSDDPLLHDHITGPVEEYRTNEKGLGYDDYDAGDRFIRIGVGVCQKPEEDDYRWTHTYDVVDAGDWSVKKGGNWIEFTQKIDAKNGYAYVLTKRLTLTQGKPELVLSHRLKNTGAKTIQTNVYNHNFFVMDSQPTGPDFFVEFPFKLRAKDDLKDMAAIQGNRLVYLRELKEGEHLFTGLDGFGGKQDDNQITIENAKIGMGVQIATDHPLSKVNYWSPRTAVCPEPFIDLVVRASGTEKWTTRYTFYVRD